jgi:hypothetical protein
VDVCSIAVRSSINVKKPMTILSEGRAAQPQHGAVNACQLSAVTVS